MTAGIVLALLCGFALVGFLGDSSNASPEDDFPEDDLPENDTPQGTEEADALTGTASDDLLSGLGGNDALDGGTGGADTLDGGAGDDTLHAVDDSEGEGDVILGGDGQDWLRGDSGDTLTGGEGRDYFEVVIEPGMDTVVITDLFDGDIDGGSSPYGSDPFGNPADRFFDSEKLTLFHPNGTPLTLAEIDALEVVDESDDVSRATYYMDGEPVLILEGLPSSFQFNGTGPSSDNGFGGPTIPEGDVFVQLDEVADGYANGGYGDDTLIGNNGSDRLYGGDGNDILDGWHVQEAERDDFTYSDGGDSLYGNYGDDTLYGNAGASDLGGSDQLFGGEGTDSFVVMTDDDPDSDRVVIRDFGRGSDDETVLLAAPDGTEYTAEEVSAHLSLGETFNGAGTLLYWDDALFAEIRDVPLSVLGASDSWIANV